jgi:NAD(P)-dependent dehydrogenase (short-subunit alcohol dehydrogenase family)
MTSKPTLVISGAGQGLGRATALHFAQHGWHCVLVGRTLSKLETVAQEIAHLSGTASAYELDVTDARAIQTFATTLQQVDCLVNSAGISLIKPIEESTLDDWDMILNANLKAPFLMTQALLPHLRKSDNASIINIGSKTSMTGFSGVSIYTAAKTGLLGLTRSMAAELRPENIRVVLLAPGPMDTPMRWSATPDYDRKLIIEPTTIAETIYWLANLPNGVTTNEFLVQSNQFEH